MRNIQRLFAIFVLAFAFVMSASAQASLTALDGGRVDVQAQRGKVVILAVGASWLPLSAKQADFTNTLAKKYAGKDVAIYFVMTDSISPRSKNFASVDDLRKFATLNKLNVSILRDSDGAITLKKFGIDQIPSFVILDKDGKQATEPFGGIDPEFDITILISRQIDKLL